MDYALLDSGHLRKLERFGRLIIARPSSLCLWRPRKTDAFWRQADAEYSPDKGWTWKKGTPEEWKLAVQEDLILGLRFQSNGQLGLFPEHAQYMQRIRDEVKSVREKTGEQSPRVLNLFAYTGMASCAAMLEGALVTHVDTAAWALGKVKENMALSNIASSSIRLIKEDALEFMKKEIRRGARYDIVIADPPMFSRPAKQKTWKLEEMLPKFALDLLRLLNRDRGFLILTNHQMQHPPLVMANLLRDAAWEEKLSLELSLLALEIKEQGEERALPAGNLVFGEIAQTS
jgi:23S rRNA (cytosine1962-C5)-methyltransferase